MGGIDIEPDSPCHELYWGVAKNITIKNCHIFDCGGAWGDAKNDGVVDPDRIGGSSVITA